YYISILPTATPYSRNAIFGGLFPADLTRIHPRFWQEGGNDERSKNRHERELLEKQVERLGLRLSSRPKDIKGYSTPAGACAGRRDPSRRFRSSPWCTTPSTCSRTGAARANSCRSWRPTRSPSGASRGAGSRTLRSSIS